MLILKKPLTIHGKNYKFLDSLPENLLTPHRIQTLINVGHIVKANPEDIGECENCGERFLMKTFGQKYCQKYCRKSEEIVEVEEGEKKKKRRKNREEV